MKDKEDHLIFHLFIIEGSSWCKSGIEKHLENEKIFNLIGHIPTDVIFNRGYEIARQMNEEIGMNIY